MQYAKVMKDTEDKISSLKEDIKHREICRANKVDFTFTNQYFLKNIDV